MTLRVIIHNAEEGSYWAEVPSLPGCVSQFETKEELWQNIKEAIELWLETDEDDYEISEQSEIAEIEI